MRKKKSANKLKIDVKKLALVTAFAFLVIVFSVLALFWNKCCTDPSCTECYEKRKAIVCAT